MPDDTETLIKNAAIAHKKAKRLMAQRSVAANNRNVYLAAAHEAGVHDRVLAARLGVARSRVANMRLAARPDEME